MTVLYSTVQVHYRSDSDTGEHAGEPERRDSV